MAKSCVLCHVKIRRINETWISDRDRFSYEGLYHADRLDRTHGTHQWSMARGGLANSI